MTSADEEQLMLVIQSRANTGGVEAAEKSIVGLSKTAQEANALGAAAAQVHSKALGDVAKRADHAGDHIDHNFKKSVHASSQLALAFAGANMSAEGMVTTVGNLSFTLASMSTNAAVAAGASGIGALAIALTTLVALIREVNVEEKASEASLQRMSAYGLRASEAQLESLRARRDAAREEAIAANEHRARMGDIPGASKTEEQKRAEQLSDEYDHLFDQVVKLRGAENRAAADRNRTLGETTDKEKEAAAFERRILELQLGGAAPLALKSQTLAHQAELRREEIDALFTLRDTEGRIVGLTHEQERAKARLLEQADAQLQLQIQLAEQEQKAKDAAYERATRALGATGDPLAEYQAKLEQIEAEKQADIQSGIDRTAAEERAQLKIKQLEQQRFEAGIQGYARLAAAAQRYGGLAAHASQTLAEAVRRFEILVQARKDAIMAKSEWAAAMASIGKHDPLGATAHFAASAGYAAAAVAGGIEAAAGSGGGSGGGAGGGAGFGDSVFTPNSDGNGGNVNLYLITRDPYGKDAIAQTVFELQRSGDLKRTVPIGPTNGLLSFAGVS